MFLRLTTGSILCLAPYPDVPRPVFFYPGNSKPSTSRKTRPSSPCGFKMTMPPAYLLQSAYPPIVFPFLLTCAFLFRAPYSVDITSGFVRLEVSRLKKTFGACDLDLRKWVISVLALPPTFLNSNTSPLTMASCCFFPSTSVCSGAK